MVSTSRNNRIEWLLLILTLPGRQAALRMRVWRRLQAVGAGVLRDGVYILPKRPAMEGLLQGLEEEIRSGKGSAQLLVVQAEVGDFHSLFDRSALWMPLLQKIATATRALPRSQAGLSATKIERLSREFEALAVVDYFPTADQGRARRALDSLQAQATARFSTDEPHARQGRIPRLKRAQHRGRVWQTRARPWVDRLASAWLIRRFIDPEAVFRWVTAPRTDVRGVLGFDYDGATFTHVADKVTFEVLMESFGLQRDPVVRRMAGLVHYLDVGGQPVAEAPGVEAMLRGMRERIRDDQQLFEAAAIVLDDIYGAYAKSPPLGA